MSPHAFHLGFGGCSHVPWSCEPVGRAHVHIRKAICCPLTQPPVCFACPVHSPVHVLFSACLPFLSLLSCGHHNSFHSVTFHGVSLCLFSPLLGKNCSVPHSMTFPNSSVFIQLMLQCGLVRRHPGFGCVALPYLRVLLRAD